MNPDGKKSPIDDMLSALATCGHVRETAKDTYATLAGERRGKQSPATDSFRPLDCQRI
jgi:hypothetical protein